MRSAKKRTKSLQGIFSTIKPSVDIMSGIANVPEDMDDWGCQLWIEYYKRIKAAHGKENAVTILNMDSERVGTFSNLMLDCKGDCGFINYFKSEGIPTGNFITDLYCGTGEVIDSVTGAVVDVAGGVGGVAKGAGNTAKMLGAIMPFVAIGAVLYFGSKYVKHGKL